MHRVFVYGTLKKGFANHDRIFTGCNIKIKPAWTYGKLYGLKWGFPAMLDLGEYLVGPDSINKVYGELVEFDDQAILKKIDRLEGFRSNGSRSNFYMREIVTVYINDDQPLQAWIYLLTKNKVNEIGGTIIPTGRW